MNIYSCGVSHKSAHVAFRERLSLGGEALEQSLSHAMAHEHIQEAMILSTCNRCELYCIAENEKGPLAWFQYYHQLTAKELDDHVYFYQHQRAVEHIIQVASGIDSMILGEPQIFGQMKEAYNLADRHGAIGPRLTQLFQFVFLMTKKVRTETTIGQQTVSIASTAVNLAKCIFSNLADLSVLLIGAGDTILLAAQHFCEQGVKKIVTANRTFDKAENLAHQFAGLAIPITEIPHYLTQCDIVLTATASKEVILTLAMVEKALQAQRKRPLFIVDIAVPRDVDARVGELDGVYLYNIDDLTQITEKGIEKRKKAAIEASKMIYTEVSDYFAWLQTEGHSDTIRAYRKKVELLREKELAKALRALQQGQAADKVLLTMAHSLTNKLMHHPSILLRNVGTNNTAFWDVAKRIFELEE